MCLRKRFYETGEPQEHVGWHPVPAAQRRSLEAEGFAYLTGAAALGAASAALTGAAVTSTNSSHGMPNVGCSAARSCRTHMVSSTHFFFVAMESPFSQLERSQLVSVQSRAGILSAGG